MVPCITDEVSGSSRIVKATDLTERQKDISWKLRRDLEKSLKNPSRQVKQIREQTHQLPAYQMRDEIVATIRTNQVTLILASTGNSIFMLWCIEDCALLLLISLSFPFSDLMGRKDNRRTDVAP